VWVNVRWLFVTTIRGARAIALSLPDSEEAEHWGNPSFRICDRIFATVPDPEHLNVMIDPFGVEAAVRAYPAACAELRWGKEVRGVKVELRPAPRRLVGDLLEAAWRRRAPKRLLAAGELQGRGRDGDPKVTGRRR
jgi:hypothetical protein